MPRAKKPTPPAEDFIAPSSDPIPTTDHIDITDEMGNVVRTYSLEVHGDTFAGLADQFIAGHPRFRKA